MGDNPYTAIPANIASRVLPQVAADNTDPNLDNLEGKDFARITCLVLYQDKTANRAWQSYSHEKKRSSIGGRLLNFRTSTNSEKS